MKQLKYYCSYPAPFCPFLKPLNDEMFSSGVCEQRRRLALKCQQMHEIRPVTSITLNISTQKDLTHLIRPTRVALTFHPSCVACKYAGRFLRKTFSLLLTISREILSSLSLQKQQKSTLEFNFCHIISLGEGNQV